MNQIHFGTYEDHGSSTLLWCWPKSSSNIVTGSNLGEISVELIKSEDRTRSAPQISALWRERIGPLPGVKEMYFGDVAAGEAVQPSTLEIAGHNLEKMSLAAWINLRTNWEPTRDCLIFQIPTRAGNAK